jgi:hypothetical protein
VRSKHHDNDRKREEVRYLKRVHEYMRREARKVIGAMKKDALNRFQRRGSLEFRKKLTWRYAPEETEIDNTADMERIRNVLELVGRPEEFDRIREEAFRES